MLRLTILSLSAALALAPGRLAAQALTGFASAVQQADLLYFAGDPREALKTLEERLRAAPTDYEALWRAARAAVVVGVDEEGSRAQNRWLDPGLQYAERAVAVRPKGIEGLYWRGAAAGRRALNASSGYASELAQRVYDDAHAILAIDPHHAGAHNLLGKLNYEVMSLSGFERALGKVFMGNDALETSSWEQAESHLLAAAKARPDFVLYQFDVAQLYLERGRPRQAREALERTVELPPVQPPDAALQKHARELLAEIRPS